MNCFGANILMHVDYILNFGKHKSQPLVQVFFENPPYIAWMLDVKEPKWELRDCLPSARWLVNAFDAKPFVSKCSAPNCDRTATHFTSDPSHYAPHWWCDDCTWHRPPWQTREEIVRDYLQLARYLMRVPQSYQANFIQVLMPEVSRAKGYEYRRSLDSWKGFFAETCVAADSATSMLIPTNGNTKRFADPFAWMVNVGNNSKA